MKHLILLSATLLFVLFVNAQIVNIPDANFKYALVNHIPVIDTNGDGEIQVSEALAFSDTIDVGDYNISDLTGIETFIVITGLYCWNNQLTTLDVSNNTALNVLRCDENQLTALDVNNNTALTELGCGLNLLTILDISNNTALKILWCNGNQLSSIDVSNNVSLNDFQCSYNPLNTLNVSNNTALVQLNCDENQLTTLDISNNTALTNLSCIDNQLNSIDVSNNTALEGLNCGGNQFTSINLSNNISLSIFGCSYSQLTTLDLSNNTALYYLGCYNTQLYTLDLSNNPALHEIHLYSNHQLSSLNVKNGTNSTSVALFAATDNPNLYCIEVDDSTWSTANWTIVDPQSYFSEDCNYVTVPDELQTSELKISPNPFTVSTTIKFNNPDNNSYVLTLTDASGRTIRKVEDVTEDEFILDRKNLKHGVYFMALKGGNSIFRGKILVE
ncbi:MAG: T9SS type A sorting domain-containing protein [Bacteroidota bacterium]